MGLFDLSGASSSGGGGGLPTLAANGIPVHVDGQWTIIHLDHAYPMLVRNRDGISGNPLLEMRTSLGEARDLDLSTVGDKPIRIEPYMSSIREILIGLPSNTPTGCVASLWTKPSKGGEKLADFAAADFATLTSWKALITRLITDRPRMADWLYLNVEVASTVPAAVSLWAHGRIMIANEETGLVFG